MELYKLKHKPTGLYYKPTKGTGSNLSTKGKIYDNNYMWNQLTNKHPEWEGKKWYNVNHYYSLEIFAWKYPNKKLQSDPVAEIFWKVHNGEMPEVEVKWDHSEMLKDGQIMIDMCIWSHPEDWEKEVFTLEKQ
jgi:hypothetical protein